MRAQILLKKWGFCAIKKKNKLYGRTRHRKGVKEILSKRLDIDSEKILRTSYFKDDLGMDSFAAVEVIFEIEDKFGTKVDEKARYKNSL